MDISWTWLGIVVLALIIFACASGFRRGFVKEIVSAFFMIISFLLVWVINPYVNTFVREYTPVYNIVQSNCQELVMEQTGSQKALDRSFVLDPGFQLRRINGKNGTSGHIENFSYGK